MASPTGDKKLIEYNAELRRKRLINYSAYVLVAGLALFLVLLIFGTSLNGILAKFGFDMSEQGLYANCSDPSNRDNPYCKPKESKANADWNNLRHSNGKSIPFSLSDK